MLEKSWVESLYPSHRALFFVSRGTRAGWLVGGVGRRCRWSRGWNRGAFLTG